MTRWIHKFWIGLALAMSCLPAKAKTVEEAFGQANQEYAKADMLLKGKESGKATEGFLRAVSLYKTCLDKAESPALHFNLGNAYFKLGKAGHSIYHFRQALLLDPSSAETRANLALARKSAKLPEMEESLYDKTLSRRSPHFWKWLLWAGIWIGAGLILLPRYFGFQGPVPIITGGVFLIFSLVPALAIQKAGEAKNWGIILEPDTTMLVSPTQESALSHELQAGQEVFLKRQEGQEDYIFANTKNGESGWVHVENLGQLHP